MRDLNKNNPSKELFANSGIYDGSIYAQSPYADDIPNSLVPNTGIRSTTILSAIPNPNSHSIIPASGYHNNFQTAMLNGSIPEFLSSAKWSDESQGFVQQTFLGASIRSFNMQGGFGDSSSTLNVDLVVDEFNVSDKTPIGEGDDIYHSGIYGDKFVPPIPGSPVFFKFGPNFATIEEAYRKTFDDLYYYNTISDPDPTDNGSVPLSAVTKGEFNLSPNQYVQLYIPDYIDSNIAIDEFAKRTIFNYSNIRNNKLSKGKDHIVFGGILQTYVQNRSSAGNPLYTVGVVDPREILSNVTLILNNYAGPIYEQANILNIYGFLEYNPTEKTIKVIKGQETEIGPDGKPIMQLPFENVLKKQVEKQDATKLGKVTYTGDDKYYKAQPTGLEALKLTITKLQDDIASEKRKASDYMRNGDNIGATASYTRVESLYTALRAAFITLNKTMQQSLPTFPMTGVGFARRGPQGIPYYRVKDAVTALMEYQVRLPKEYKDQGFGGKINFRGYNYVFDFSGLPDLPNFYYLEFDQINLLELALEICDITSRDLFVTLLPVIDHPACSHLYSYNKYANPNELIAGIIRVDTVNRSEQPFYGAIKRYIDSLATNKIYVENQDLGYELSNIVTDKFIVGAQEVDMYYFSANTDRDILAFKKTGKNNTFPNKPTGYQWTLEASLEQQILPYYGKLGNNTVTIPKGFGSYQQILLDSSSLNAAGVGTYYVATEMELRCALVSYDKWKDFLMMYNDIYMESIESNDPYDSSIAGLTPNIDRVNNPPQLDISKNYVVGVPRSVFDTYVSGVKDSQQGTTLYGKDGLPLSPCNPPYGYPLYYKRMTKIGIPEAGLTTISNRLTSLTTNLNELLNADPKDIKALINSQFQNLKRSKPLTAFEKKYFDRLETLMKNPTPKAIQDTVGFLQKLVDSNAKLGAILPAIARKNQKNALKVYEFVKSIAEECLGKKFLIKLPKEVNIFYDNKIAFSNERIQEYISGPFGFRPRSTKNIAGYEFTQEFKGSIEQEKRKLSINDNFIQSFLNSGIKPNPEIFAGSLRVNYNPIADKYESNYTPTNIGGYFNFDLYQNTLGVSALKDMAKADFNKLPSGIKQGLIPQDLTNFINEDGRINAYVRFDHSQNLALEGINDSEFTQQFITSNFMIPDLVEALDNTGPQQSYTFSINNGQENNIDTKPKQMLFVKCSVDESLYFAPKIIYRKVSVHAQKVKDVGTLSIPSKIFIPCSGINEATGKLEAGSGVYVDSFPFYKANYVPLPEAGGSVNILDFDRHNPFLQIPGGTVLNDSFYVKSEFDALNDPTGVEKDRFPHVYALITLPTRITPIKDTRFRDGLYQSMNAEQYKHYMTMDTVKGLDGFDKPTNPLQDAPNGTFDIKGSDGKSLITVDNKIKAWLAMKRVHERMSFGFPQVLNRVSPSPVYPDLVALPLMSHDRCYGPWISSQLDGQAYILKNIGGKVEFIKDENLSPWNYAGYELMNEAGRLQAEFSNSLLLFSERGSFTIPSLPQGNSLCKALINGGPLVTSINMDVSNGGIRTTYQMDLYTSSFGKLQKQKQEEISKLSRERKKILSERNGLIRKGLGKNQSARNFQNEYDTMKNASIPTANDLGLGMANTNNIIVGSVQTKPQTSWSSSLGFLTFDNNGNVNKDSYIYDTDSTIVGSLQSPTQIYEVAQNFPDEQSMARNYQDSASKELIGNNGVFTITSLNGFNGGRMPYVERSKIDASQDLYHLDQEDIENDIRGQISNYGDTVS